MAWGWGGLAAEWLCLLPILVYSFTKSDRNLLVKFVNQTSRVLHAFYSAHASARLCLSTPSGSLWRDTQGTLGDSPWVAGGG